MEKKYGPLTLSLNEEEGALTVTACDKAAETLTIPMRVDGLPVVGIGERAFADCSKLKEIVFPEADDALFFEGKTFREIGGNAFMNCTSLREVDLPDNVDFIGWGAFYGCTSLVRAHFSSEAYVSGYAFVHCTALKEVTPLSTVSEGVFSHCESLTVLPVTDTLDEIEDDAFEHCDGLTEIVFPASLERIGDLSFRGCQNLSRATFASPDGWYVTSRYTEDEDAVDLSDPEKNAYRLSHVDFDDGPNGMYKRKE
jgi:hypothetical protein